jgi:heme oxygenase
VIEALRDATRSRHTKLGASPAMARLFDANYTISEYREHLGRLLGLFEPIERAVADATHPGDPVRDLQKSSALRDDLRAMGATTRDIGLLERYHGLAPIDPRGLRGYTYVILGSMMGGKIIVKRLRAVLGANASFRFYGEGNGRPEALWASFCSDLEEKGKGDVHAICATAVAIFDAYEAWLSGSQRSPPLRQSGVASVLDADLQIIQ